MDGVCVFLVTMVVAAQMPKVESAPAQYPRVTTSICYEVDATWPDRPKDIAWGQMPGVAVDRQDQIWIATRAEPPVQLYTAEGTFVQSLGSKVIAGKLAKSLIAHFLRIDNQGMLFLADAGNHCVWRVSPGGKRLMVFGTPGEPGNDATHLNKPTDMAIAPNGDVFVADGYGNARVVHFDMHGRFIKSWGKLGTAPGEFSVVHGIAVDSQGNVYLGDIQGHRAQKFVRRR